ncbi:diacylglycerol kinase family protein [Prolixibacter sp. SD074]|uniref:diacylglycerol/lipid kinase family protein n=1 Tax=Prolixibacter sp. SD074 TaxID=2652391 RepID=UPI00128776BE|nr:diacylglycerol kinase family protein [Prolixibacter sp. SD074]GET28359.1 hypothetical protein SD074_05610 [Prolixibacter sp. SD074]
MGKILFVINPVSGGIDKDEAVLRIHWLAVREKFDFKFRYTTGVNDDEALRHEIDWYRPDRAVACGGDGTVLLVARNLLNEEIPIGILPLGSANGLATELAIPGTLPEAVELAVNGQTSRPIDLLRFNHKYLGIHLGDIGVNALIVKNYAKSGDRRMVGYARHLFRAFQESELMRYTIKTPEGEYQKEGYMLAFANARKFGTGIYLSRNGSMSDGLFEICNFRKIEPEDLINLGLSKFELFLDEEMYSDVISCKEAEITIDRKVDFQIDGEYIGKLDHLTISMVESAVKIIVAGGEDEE